MKYFLFFLCIAETLTARITVPFFLGLGDGPHKTNAATAMANPTLANTAIFSTSISPK